MARNLIANGLGYGEAGRLGYFFRLRGFGFSAGAVPCLRSESGYQASIMALTFVLTLLIPLFKLVPPLYRWRIRSRVHRKYKELLMLEGQIGEEDPAKLAAALDAISKEILDLEIPPSYADELYHLRSHIDMVRQRLQGSQPAGNMQ